MNKKTRTIAALLLSAMATTAIIPPSSQVAAAATTSTTNAPVNFSLEGPRNAKEVEAFVNSVFKDLMKKHNVPGSNFSLVADGKVLVSKGYGYADREKKIPVDKDTVFQIGSVTKQFTALAAMQMVDKGKIDLRGDIQKYLGGLKIPNTTGKKLTMYDLLTYSTGFEKPDIASYYSTEYVNKEYPIKDFLKTHMTTVVRPPGETYVYDNFGFLIAGYAVENASGMPYSKYMEKNIFNPLGMTSTSVRNTPELVGRMAAHYSLKGERIPMDGTMPTEKPEGGMISTADDMAKYLLMHLNKGKYDGKEIVSQKSIEQMHTYQYFADKTVPITTIGFEGYFPEMMNGQHVIIKGGNVTGHSSLIVILPEKNAAFYMTNNDDNPWFSIEVYQAFMNHYYPKKKEVKPTYSALSEQQAKAYVGLYENIRMNSFRSKVSYSNGQLVSETPSGKHTLKMISPSLFEDESGNKVTFNKNAAGKIAYMYVMTLPEAASMAEKVNVDSPFSDVPASSKYKPYINNLNALKVMSGKSVHIFDPKGTITQAEFSEVLLRAHGWYKQPYMIEPNKKQMVAGLSNFYPNSPITRQMAAVMIQNLKQVELRTKIKLNGKTDAWAVKAIEALVSQGIMDPDTKVKSDGSVNFRSKELLKRQEASALLDQAFNYYALPIRH
ncbi:beta-lactamase family protein [Paenibacillus sp. UMB4589-SE434]|uniref:beta-lactamase family protein n=1 Tax=Paenibacillus sp. UMB4589-SE434 TaxID=3046314 RepID=UPI002550C20E|nr:beta-lactamase family protein [Paenibacillus sp. UMB4589-SE434]MDK8180515.1 beta-lactamase family protein [Paenibacillus sp. UMB4589-SE434]